MQPIRPASPSTIRTQDLSHAATTTAAGAGAPVRPDSAGATAGARQAAIDTAPPTTDLRATLSRLNARLGEVQSKDAAAQSADAALEQVGALLDDIATETKRATAGGSDLAASRAKIDGLLEQVRVAAGDAARSPVPPSLAPTARVGEGADATREQDTALAQISRLDGPSLLGGGSGALDLLSLAKDEAAAERERIAEFRQSVIRPELASLTDQVTAAMLGRAANAGRPPAAELTPERAAALLRGRTGA